MTEALWFVTGMMIGGVLGIALMCILQVGREDDY